MSISETGLSAKITHRIELLSKNRHQLYLLSTVLLALTGYALFLFFPFMFLFSVYLLIGLIQGIQSVQDWIWVGLVSSIAAICINVSYYSFRLKFSQVQGLKLSRNVAPGIYEVVKEVREHYRRPKIHNIVITENYEIRLERIPRTGAPMLFHNTLVIGLPLLQTLSPDEFRCEVARCIGQHSVRLPGATLFIYRSRALWQTYNRALKKNNNTGVRIMRWFFIPYSSLFDLVTIPAIRQQEINADSHALDFINEQVVLDTLKSESIARAFLELHYWTSVRSMVVKDPKADIMPFAKLEKVLKSISTKESREKWLNYAYEAELLPGDTMPSLRERMEGIGHIKVRSVPVSEINAAEAYLGKNKNKVVSIVEKLWRATTLAPWLKSCKIHRKNLEKIQRLSRKSRQQVLWPADIIRYALLARKLNGSPLRESISKLLKRNLKHSIPAFLTGKIRPQANTGDLFR